MCKDFETIRLIPITEDQLRAAIHELLGFIEGSELMEQDKDRARNMPMVKFVTTPHWLIPASAKLEIK